MYMCKSTLTCRTCRRSWLRRRTGS